MNVLVIQIANQIANSFQNPAKLLDLKMLYAPMSYLYYTLPQNKWVQGVKGVNVTLYTALPDNYMRDQMVDSALCKNEESADFCYKA